MVSLRKKANGKGIKLYMRDKIFINCPYDEEYKCLFFALIYICELFGYEPTFAACDESSGDRMKNIVSCIIESRYSIHDISKTREELPRFNMPFELGMYYMHIIENNHSKKMLILEGEKDKSDKTLSDLSGMEIKCHYNKIEGVFSAIRPFFMERSEKPVDSANKMFKDYLLVCILAINDMAVSHGYSNYLEMDFLEFKKYVEYYLGGIA